MKNNIKTLLWTGAILSFIAFAFSMRVFIQISTKPIDMHTVWKFYASLAGFTIFAAICIVNVVLLVMRPKK